MTPDQNNLQILLILTYAKVQNRDQTWKFHKQAKPIRPHKNNLI